MWLNLWNPAHKITVYIKFPMATRWRDEQMMLSCYCASSLSHLCSLCVLPRDACTTANNMAPDSQSEARAPGWKVMGLLVASWMDFLKHRQFVPVGENKCLQRACVCVFSVQMAASPPVLYPVRAPHPRLQSLLVWTSASVSRPSVWRTTRTSGNRRPRCNDFTSCAVIQPSAHIHDVRRDMIKQTVHSDSSAAPPLHHHWLHYPHHACSSP